MRISPQTARRLVHVLSLGCLLAGCDQSDRTASDSLKPDLPEAIVAAKPRVTLTTPAPSSPIVAAARAQVGRTTVYDPSYVGLAYPGGDVSIERGVCTDVVVRALRDAHGIDLQKLVHEDMKAAFSEYPTIWGLRGPDRNIDHRRVPNLQCYFQRKGWALAVTKSNRDYLPGDLVTCTVPPNRDASLRMWHMPYILP